jgi:transposase
MNKNSWQYFIGIDVSRNRFNYVIIDASLQVLSEGQLNMNLEGFTALSQLISSYPNSLIGVESTGSYHLNLLAFLITNQYPVALINPALIKKFSQSITLRNTKTDRIDALTIARFLLKHLEVIPHFIPDKLDDLAALARVRESLTQQIARTKTQLKQHLVVVFPELVAHCNIFTDFLLSVLEEFPTPHSVLKASPSRVKAVFRKLKARGRKPSLSAEQFLELARDSIGISTTNYALIIKHEVEMLQFLNQKLQEITRQFIEEIQKNQKDNLELLKSIKGVSDVTSAHFLAAVKDIHRFENRRKLAAYAGIDPSIKQSGSLYARGRISKKGSKSLRRCLYLMASGVMRCNEYFRAYYLKKRGEGMPHRKAMIALCNKLLRVIFAMLRKGEKFVPVTHYL